MTAIMDLTRDTKDGGPHPPPSLSSLPVQILEPAFSSHVTPPLPVVNAVCFSGVASLCFVLQIFTLAPDLRNTNIYQKLNILGTIPQPYKKASIVPHLQRQGKRNTILQHSTPALQKVALRGLDYL